MKIACVTITSPEFSSRLKIHQESVRTFFPEGHQINYPFNAFKSPYSDTLQHILASRPKAVLETFKRGYDMVLFMGADVVFYSKPVELLEWAKKYDAILFPHITEPLPDDGLFPKNEGIAKTGHLNTDFVLWKNTPEVIEFLTWQDKMLETKCLANANIFYDQTWLNFAPMFLDKVLICRNPKYNIAYWNLGQRDLDDIVCFQFSGFDENNSKIISKHQNRFGANSELLKFLNEYAKKVKENEKK